MATANYKFYKETYGGSLIPEDKFTRVANNALKTIEQRTAWRVTTAVSAPYEEELKSCTCELAEEFYQHDLAKAENGMVVTSYSNDGESASFANSMTEEAVAERCELIMQKWLLRFGLMYTGVVLNA